MHVYICICKREIRGEREREGERYKKVKEGREGEQYCVCGDVISYHEP